MDLREKIKLIKDIARDLLPNKYTFNVEAGIKASTPGIEWENLECDVIRLVISKRLPVGGFYVSCDYFIDYKTDLDLRKTIKQYVNHFTEYASYLGKISETTTGQRPQ